jgi:hypothetical protein
VLGNTGDPMELFLIDSCDDNPLGSISAKCFVSAFYHYYYLRNIYSLNGSVVSKSGMIKHGRE